MFSIGDHIIYGVEGVCRVDEVGRLKVAGLDKNRDYYRLTPYYRGGTIYTPVDGRAVMRPVISREALEALLPRLPELEPLAVIRGTAPTVELTAQPPAEGIVIPKGQREAMTQTVNLAESLEAPIAAGTEVGTVTVTVEGQTVASYPVVTAAAVERMTFGRAFQRLGQGLLAMG